MPTKRERVCGRTLVLRSDARGRLTSIKLEKTPTPWVELDPSVPQGEVHWSHFGDTSVWRRGKHHETTGGPFESERTTKQSYGAFVADQLTAMRVRLVASTSPRSLAAMREVFAYVHEHALVGARCRHGDSKVASMVRAYAARTKAGERAEVLAALADLDFALAAPSL